MNLFIFATALIGFPLILNVTCEHWSKFDAVLTAAMSRFSRGFPFCDLTVGDHNGTENTCVGLLVTQNCSFYSGIYSLTHTHISRVTQDLIFSVFHVMVAIIRDNTDNTIIILII